MISVSQGPGKLTEICDCAHSYYWTCKAHEDPIQTPGRWIMNTSDILFNLENFEVNEWLLQTHNSFINSRFGGWSGNSESSPTSWINGTPTKLIAWYNNKAFHALPAYTNALHNAMLRALIGPDHAQEYGISTFSHPLKMFTGSLDAESM